MTKGLQEGEKPQLDSHTLLRESLKLYFAIAANEGFGIRSVDIRVVFLQARGLDKKVYMEPTKDIKKKGMIWKLNKPKLCVKKDLVESKRSV